MIEGGHGDVTLLLSDHSRSQGSNKKRRGRDEGKTIDG